MSMKETRRIVLVKDGFTKWEARALARNSIKTPSMVQLRSERRQLLNELIMEFSARELSGQKVPKFSGAYRKYIYKMYDEKKWYTLDGQRNPFARLREIIETFKFRNPDFRTPQPKTKSRVIAGEYQRRAGNTRNKGNGNKIIQDEKTIGQSKAKQAEKKARMKLSEVD